MKNGPRKPRSGLIKTDYLAHPLIVRYALQLLFYEIFSHFGQERFQPLGRPARGNIFKKQE
jgi:hypothetical protein